jgi:hypothetical protein
LTASLPRRYCAHTFQCRRAHAPALTAEGWCFVMSGFAPLAKFPCGSVASNPSLVLMELAKGFEPPTG